MPAGDRKDAPSGVGRELTEEQCEVAGGADDAARALAFAAGDEWHLGGHAYAGVARLWTPRAAHKRTRSQVIGVRPVRSAAVAPEVKRGELMGCYVQRRGSKKVVCAISDTPLSAEE